MSQTVKRAQRRAPPSPAALEKAEKPQEFYDAIKGRFAEERDLRLRHRPEGTAQFTSDLEGPLAAYAIDPTSPSSRRVSRSPTTSRSCSSAAASRPC